MPGESSETVPLTVVARVMLSAMYFIEPGKTQQPVGIGGISCPTLRGACGWGAGAVILPLV
jgi:hypothetical protein